MAVRASVSFSAVLFLPFRSVARTVFVSGCPLATLQLMDGRLNLVCNDRLPVSVHVCACLWGGVSALWWRLAALCEGKRDESLSEKQGFAFLLTALGPRYRVLAGTIWLFFVFLRI